MSVLSKEFYGSSKYAVEIYTDSTVYHADMKGKVLFYEGRHLDQEKPFNNFNTLARIIRDYWAKHVGEVFDRRLASWFVEYGMESDFEEQSITDLLALIKGETESYREPTPEPLEQPPQASKQHVPVTETTEPPVTPSKEASKPPVKEVTTLTEEPSVKFSSAIDVNSLEKAVLEEAEKLKHSKQKPTEPIVKKTEIHVEDLDKKVIEKVKKQAPKQKKRKRAPRK